MAGISVALSVELEGYERASSLIAELGRRIQHPRSALEEIGSLLEASTLQRFENGQDPEGIAWEPSERALDQGGQTLVDTSRLRGSITHLASDSEVEVGTNVIYGRIHQLGGEAGRGKTLELRPRPYLGVSDGDRGAIEKVVRRYLERAA